MDSGQKALAETLADTMGDVSALLKAISPFLRIARGIPDNWPGQCVLICTGFEGDPIRSLNYLKEGDGPDEPTINDYRELLRVAQLVCPPDEE